MQQTSKRHFLALSLVLLGACAAQDSDPTDDPDDLGDPSLPDEPGEGLADPPPATDVGMVMTPTGMVDHSCVQQIEDGESVDDSGVVTRVDGTTYTLPACSGDTMPVHAQQITPTINGWMEAAWWDAPHWMRRMHGHFVVPPPPSNKGNQTVFFFPSFEPRAGDRIIQPVLQWGPSAAGGGKYWAIASWYVGPGHTIHSPLRRVSVDDVLYGSISGANCTPGGTCSWTIVTTDVTHKKSTTAKVRSTAPYSQIQGGVLEAYNISRCDQLPSNGVITFYDLAIYNSSLARVTPDFKPFYWDHSCRESQIIGTETVWLEWN